MLGQPSEIDEVLVEQHVHDGEQQRRIGAGPRRDVAVGQFGGAGAGRVDDDEPCRRVGASARSLPGKSAAVARLPLDTSGFAPMITR